MRLAALLALLLAGSASAVEKRPMPDYDGRPDAGVTAGDVLIWVPRILVSPLYLISEFVIRRPVGVLVRASERGRWPQRIRAFFISDDGKRGWLPSFYVESGYRPVAGLYLFADDAIVTGNNVRFSGVLGFGHRAITVSDRLNLGPMGLTLRLFSNRRDDKNTYGAGPDTMLSDERRYGERRYEASLAADAKAGILRGRAQLGYRDLSFFEGTFDEDDPRIDLPPYAGFVERGRIEIDTRSDQASGFRLQLDVEHGPSWTRVMGLGGASLGLGRGRVASLSVVAGIADQSGDEPIPVTELVLLGGAGPLPGFTANRLAGRSGIAAVVQYEWPIWVWLNGALHVATGNVFNRHFDQFNIDKLRLSGGLGLRTAGTDFHFELLVAAGTDTFADGAAFEALRFVIGGTHAF